MKANLHAHAVGSGLGISITVEVLAVDPRGPGQRHDRVSVHVRLPDGREDSFQVRDLTMDDYSTFDVEAARSALLAEASMTHLS